MVNDDIVKWLRMIAPDARAFDPQSRDDFSWPLKNGILAAADEIERLRKQLADQQVLTDGLAISAHYCGCVYCDEKIHTNRTKLLNEWEAKKVTNE